MEENKTAMKGVFPTGEDLAIPDFCDMAASHFRATARELGIPEDRYIEELRKVNIRSPEQIQASFDLLTAAITMFVRSSYQARLNNQSLIERTSIISSLGTLYFCDFFIDLATEHYRELDSTSWARDVLKPYAKLKASEIAKVLLPLVVTPDFQNEFSAFADFTTLKERLKGHKSIALEYISTNSGWCRAVFIPVRIDETGAPLQVIFAIQDINEEKFKELQIQETLRKAAEEATEASKAKTDFLSRMSHDIRTPLKRHRRNDLSRRSGEEPRKTTEYLEKIDTSSKFLLGLINDILDMAKVESNKIVLHPEPYPLAEFNELSRFGDSAALPGKEHSFHFLDRHGPGLDPADGQAPDQPGRLQSPFECGEIHSRRRQSPTIAPSLLKEERQTRAWWPSFAITASE
jgi:hypothetical protein